MKNNQKKIILASKSPQRFNILKSLGLEFEVVAPVMPEEINDNQKPSLIVKNLSLQKANEIKSKILIDKSSNKDFLIIAADTVIYCNNEIIGKPKSKLDAKRILKKLSTTPHFVYTGFTIIYLPENKIITGYEKTKIVMNEILEKYFDEIIEKHCDKAGCYAIQDDFDFIKYIKGDFYNVVGLPKKRIYEELKKNLKNIRYDISSDIEKNEFFMRKVFELAKKGKDKTYPNPLVGALIIDENDFVIGQGYHRCFGKAHAEVEALKSVKNKDKIKLKNSTMFVNLEPCCHWGKTPPCTDAIIKSEIKNVVISNIDSNKKVSGNGIKILKENNINVVVGVLEQEGNILNSKFFSLHKDLRIK
jgi:MAF protein